MTQQRPGEFPSRAFGVSRIAPAIAALTLRQYMPPPPPGVSPPPQWGDPNIVRERLGTAVTEIVFDRDRMNFPALSLPGYRAVIERTAGPMLKLVEMLSASDPARLTQFRREYDALLAPYFENNILRQDYLLTRARKR